MKIKMEKRISLNMISIVIIQRKVSSIIDNKTIILLVIPLTADLLFV